MRLENFLDVGIVALNFAVGDRENRHSHLIIHILLAFGEITHFSKDEILASSFVLTAITLIFAVQCDKKL